MPAMSVSVLALLCALLFSALPGCGKDDEKTKEQAAPPQVRVQPVELADVEIIGEYVGQLRAKKTVELRARVAGFLLERHFQEGDKVKEGDLLFVIDPKPFQESLKQAKAELSRALAQRKKAETDFMRFKKLYEQEAVSKEEYDTAETEMLLKRADVDTAKADVTQAELNLSYTKVHAPMDGQIGRTMVNIGNLVGQGENTLLAVMSTVDPMYATFSVPEKEYVLAKKAMLANPDVPDDRPVVPFRIILADGAFYDRNGTFSMLDRAVDPETGTIGLRAVFPNPDGVLRDGQFAKVLVRIDTLKSAKLVPVTAVVDVQGRKSLLTVGGNGTIVSKPITPEHLVNGTMVVSGDVEPGEMIIATGVNRFRPGQVITPVRDDAARNSNATAPAK